MPRRRQRKHACYPRPETSYSGSGHHCAAAASGLVWSPSPSSSPAAEISSSSASQCRPRLVILTLVALTEATAPLPPSDLRNQHDLAIRPQLRPIRVLEDLAVDRHRHPLLHLLPQPGKALVQLQHQAPKGRRRQLELRLAAGEPLTGVAREDDLRHQSSPLATSSALRTFGGDIGRLCRRRPIASRIALPTAAIGGMIGTSPTPRAPNGWRGLGTSTRIASIIGRSEATGQR